MTTLTTTTLRRRRRAIRRAASASSAGALLAVALTACAREVAPLPAARIAEPDATDVESVVFLIGDAGYADQHRHPIIQVLRADVEDWSQRLGRDSAVVVLFLGDIVYPRGVRDASDPHFPADSAIVTSQVAIVAGTAARRFGTLGYFMAGNHDWGNARGVRGVDRLRNLETFLDRRRAEGTEVRLQPEAGEPGPAVIDIGRQTRILILDTAWWLLARNDPMKVRSFQQMTDAVHSAGERNIIVSGHHPLRSASSHGGLVPFWRTFGLRFLLSRSGALLQDLSSVTYREMREALLEAFRARRPLLFAGGHDHSLQVIQHDTFPQPRYSVVAGSASKVSNVGSTAGMRYRHAAPGYMRVVTHHGGRVDLFVIAAPGDEFLACADDNSLAQCMAARTAAFATTYSMRLQ